MDFISALLAIVLDDKVISAPNINDEIRGGRGVITGRFTLEEAQDLARILKEGALPLNVSIVEEEVVGQSIGADSVKAGATALLMSAILVGLFMIIVYRLSGVLATIAMLVNVILIIAVLSPLLCYILQKNSENWFGGWQISFELLIVNAVVTAIGLALISRKHSSVG